MCAEDLDVSVSTQEYMSIALLMLENLCRLVHIYIYAKQAMLLTCCRYFHRRNIDYVDFLKKSLQSTSES